VFALTEALAAAAERLGLPAELSMGLARGTVEGAAELMRRENATPPATLRSNVSSPGGTTAAALAVLLSAQGLEDLMIRATAAARRRAAEMAG
jgi:pyrroline-5-carboxylate reductase